MPNWKKLITSGSSGSLAYLSVDTSIDAQSFTGSFLSNNGVLSSSAQIASDISGSITSTSSSIATDIASLVSFSSSLETTIYDYTGSFTGDGSNLTGINTTIVSSSTVSETFTNATTHSVTHTLGTKDLIVNVYDSNDDIFVPSRINTPTTSSVVIYMNPATTGRVVIGKAGHIVSGSSLLDNTGVISGSAQIASNISGSLSATAIATLEAGIFSGSAQLPSGIISGAAQLPSGTVSGSSQINLASATGTAANATSASYAENSATSSRSVNKNTNSGSICFWQGSQSEWDAISSSADSSTIYFVV